jgi:hypothetical protein
MRPVGRRTKDATQDCCAPHRVGEGMRRMERRTDPWADFLRRILLSASLASAAAVTTNAGTDPSPAEVAEAEPQQQPEIAAAAAKS